MGRIDVRLMSIPVSLARIARIASAYHSGPKLQGTPPGRAWMCATVAPAAKQAAAASAISTGVIGIAGRSVAALLPLSAASIRIGFTDSMLGIARRRQHAGALEGAPQDGDG